MGIENIRILHKNAVFSGKSKKNYGKTRFFLNFAVYICDIIIRKPAKPLSSDTLNLVGVSFWGEQ
ncbi:MAG: hypothetical protein A2Y10_11520 [Planctomycetes bacterium GWF2_41_51]|nr:MAG: hypothetical protein A2Y10_11520 [Planctomycetes bacterium GWF2_41_51]